MGRYRAEDQERRAVTAPRGMFIEMAQAYGVAGEVAALIADKPDPEIQSLGDTLIRARARKGVARSPCSSCNTRYPLAQGRRPARPALPSPANASTRR
jgi:hypothetical protein